MNRPRIIAVALLTLVMLTLVELHVHGVNGPRYGMITWRRYPAVKTYLLMLLCALPTLGAIALYPRIRRYAAALLILPMIGAMAGKLAFAELRSIPGQHLEFVCAAVEHPLATSYYTDAVALSNFPGWLADFPRIMPMLNLHSQTKAPGMILYYMAFVKTLGHSDRTALIAGLVLGAISTLAIPACYWLILTLRNDKTEAFLSACFLALCPGFLLFFPVSDPAYTILSCAIGACWILALRRKSVAWSIATGAVTGAILLVSFNLLAFDIFLVGYTLVLSQQSWRNVLRLAAIALVTCVTICGVLWICTGYNPVATFQSAWRNQHALLAEHAGDRPYPDTAWNDLLDFALGAGWIGFLMAGFGVADAMKHGWESPSAQLVLLCIGLPILVAVTALLAAETARVWNFMLPLLMVPVAMELSRMRAIERVIAFACLAVMGAAICRNMSVFM
jgi:hypothetical protein